MTTTTTTPTTFRTSLVRTASMGAVVHGLFFGRIAPSSKRRRQIQAPALVVPQVGGGTIDITNLRGKPVWIVRRTPEQLAAFVRAETAKWSKVVKDSGAKAD